MCTIGALYRDDGNLYLFKNRDLIEYKENPLPLIEKGINHKYIKFGVDIENKIPGIWAGVNDGGLAIVGADGNCIYDYKGPHYGGGEKTWEAYEIVLSKYESVSEAYPFIMEYYFENKIGGAGDIIIMADRNRAVALEYTMNLWSLQFSGEVPYIVRTNFFLNMPHLRVMPETNSVHLSSAKRYERAIGLLSANSAQTTIEDVKNLLCDKANGPGSLSICREGGHGEYKTVCSVIFEISKRNIKAHYVMNEIPLVDKYQILEIT